MATVWLWLAEHLYFLGESFSNLIYDSGWTASVLGYYVFPRRSYLVSIKVHLGKFEIKLQGVFVLWENQCTINMLSLSQELSLTVIANCCSMYRLLVERDLRKPVFYRMSLLCTIQAKEREKKRTNLDSRQYSLEWGLWKQCKKTSSKYGFLFHHYYTNHQYQYLIASW